MHHVKSQNRRRNGTFAKKRNGKPRRYILKLTKHEALELLRNKKYIVNLKTGEVYGRMKNKLIYTQKAGRDYNSPVFFVTLYSGLKKRMFPLTHIIWMSGNDTILPDGFEIHHRDTNPENNAFENLYALYYLDHKKLEGRLLIERNGNIYGVKSRFGNHDVVITVNQDSEPEEVVPF